MSVPNNLIMTGGGQYMWIPNGNGVEKVMVVEKVVEKEVVKYMEVPIYIDPKKYNVRCPLCKRTNFLDYGFSNRFVYAKDIDDCCICMDKKSDVYFPQCGHVCACKGCVLNLMLFYDSDLEDG